MMFYFSILLAILFVWVIVVQVLFKYSKSKGDNTFDRLKTAMGDMGMSVSADSDPDLTASLMYNINRWFKRLGYKCELRYSESGYKKYTLDGDDKPHPVFKLFILLVSSFKVLVYPFVDGDSI